MTDSLRVCLADDDADSRNIMSRFLELLGHRVVFAADNGEKLVQRIAEEDLDLVIVDLEMPVLDGLAAAEEICGTKHIPVILVSGHSDFSHIVRDQEPVATYLTKPVLIQSLQKAIEQALQTTVHRH